VRNRGSTLALGAILLVAAACGGGDGPDGERLAIYHLEESIGRPGDEGELRCGPPRAACPGVVEQPPPRQVRYDARGSPALDESMIDRTGVRVLGSAVTVPLRADGTAAFARVTREIARTGGRDQGWHHLAIVVGDEIVAFPEVDFDAYPDGIPDASSVSIPAVSPEDARELARRLRGD
jgi:hypothetical protein